MKATSTCAALCVAFLLAGCSAPVPTLQDRTVTLSPDNGGFAELNLLMKKGDVVRWSWSTAGGQKVYFNVHTHNNGTTQYPLEMETASDDGSFTAPEGTGYSLMWQAFGKAPVTLHDHVTGSAILDPLYPPVP